MKVRRLTTAWALAWALLATPLAPAAGLNPLPAADHPSTRSAEALSVESVLEGYQELVGLESELRIDNLRTSFIASRSVRTARERGQQQFFDDGELQILRFSQLRVIHHLSRVLELLRDWNVALMMDSEIRFKPELRVIVAAGAQLYSAYLNWYLATVAGGHEAHFGLNPLFEMLDRELPEGSVNIGGGVSPRLPAGSIRALMHQRLDASLQGWLVKVINTVPAPPLLPAPALRVAVAGALRLIPEIRRHEPAQPLSSESLEQALENEAVSEWFHTPRYAIVSTFGTAIGRAKVIKVKRVITPALVADLIPRLQPGDLLLSREDFNLSNLFIPSRFIHTGIYLGTAEEWGRLKLPGGMALKDDPWIRSRILPRYVSYKGADPARVIEGFPEGVVFNSAEASLAQDDLLVLRPRFAPEVAENHLASAIRRALGYYGRPYDFDFNFLSDDRILCTELAYRAYDSFFSFALQRKAPNANPSDGTPAVPGMTEAAGNDVLTSDGIARLALYMVDHPQPDPATGYPGLSLQIIRLYHKVDGQSTAEVYDGDAAIARLRTLVSPR